MPIFLEPPQHNPRGPDGLGWNRMSMGQGEPPAKCALRPKTEETFWESKDTRKAEWGNYWPCDGHGGGDCTGCPRLSLELEWQWLGDELVIRVDEEGRAWVMHRPDRGWGEYGKIMSWERLSRLRNVEFTRGRDEHGRLIRMKRVN